MKVSVVVPCYNHAKYVEQCLASIDAQDHDDLEVIVVDDGSKDDSWARVRAHRWKPTRTVRLLRTANHGAHAALNLGLAQATGEYVALCNSDDWFEPGRLSQLAAHAQESGARLLFSEVRCVDERGLDITQSWPYATDLFRKQREIAEYPSVGFALVLTNVAISTGNFFLQRALLDEVGLFRPYRYCHDWDFVLRALLVTEPFYVAKPLYAYRLHRENSFLALQEAAARECPELMRRFLKAAVTGRPANRLAPSPRNWPGYFEYFIEEHRYQPYLVAWEGIDVPVYRPAPGEQSRVLESA
ncbi:MAG: glycosyltransferase family 2 protein [Myxococcaceae bacterium]